jgi:predicted AAA+ superfamily ATPase
MGFRSLRDTLASPLSGALWETHVFNQILRHYAFRGERPPLWYWRTPYGHEVDIVIEEGGGRLLAVECKLSENPSHRDSAGIRALRQFYGSTNVPKAFIACRTPRAHAVDEGILAVDGSEWEKLL